MTPPRIRAHAAAARTPTPAVLVNGKPVASIPATDIVPAGDGVISLILDRRAYEVRICGDEAFLNGRRYSIEVIDPRQWRRGLNAGAGEPRVSLRSPMPGRVVRTLVNAGDRVELGQAILVVEAMKMQNEIKSPRKGIVVSLSVKQGDPVTAGTVLAVIE